MEKKKNASQEEAADWANVWIQQSQLFYKIADEQLKYFFERGHQTHPEQHMDLITQWLDVLTKQWHFSPFNEKLKSYDQYNKLMTEMMAKTSQMLIDRWTAIAKTNQPVNNVRDLYELWLSCCHDVYSEAMHSKAYQDIYGELMNQTLRFWNSMMQSK